MFHADSSHTGWTGDTSLRAGNAASLGIQWMENTGAGTNNSPAVVYNSTLDRTLVYTASKYHIVSAYDAQTGERVWYFQAGAEVTSSPAVYDGVVYIGSDDHKLYAFNATTGAKICSFDTGGVINSSPLVEATQDGTIVYLGDNGLSGGSDGGHVRAVNGVDPNAATNCSLKWSYNQFGNPPGSQPLAGSWSPPTWMTLPDGTNLLAVGSSSPDCSVYAFDPLTGARVWRFETRHISFDADVGAGTTFSAPGVDGFAGGVLYAIGKSHVFYALDPATGTELWEFDVNVDEPNFVGSTRSTPALADGRVFFGYGEGVYALDAVTGAKLWRFKTDSLQEVVASPAVSGPAGDQVVFVTDLSGKVYGLDAATGAKLWSYQTGGFSYSSPAIWNGHVLVGSSDGFLYSFGIGGGASASPTAKITSPLDGSTLPNTTGTMTITGTATDDQGVQHVLVGVKQHNGNGWWNGAANNYQDVFASNEATLTSPGATSTTWSYSVPVASTGGAYTVQAEAVDGDGLHTAPVAQVVVSVNSTGHPPDTAISQPVRKDVFALPPVAAPIPITIEGSATDDAGAHPGVQAIRLVIKNKEHNEYYCGYLGCGGPNSYFTPTYTRLMVVPDSPGATSTLWTYTFYTMDHPHNYGIQAQAIDLDNERDPTKAGVSPICIRLAGQGCAGAVG